MEATVTVESASISADLKKMAQGEPGLSAYEVAVKEGYTGTEAEWVAYLSTNADQAIAAANAAKASQDAADASATAAASSEDAAAASASAASASDTAAATSASAAKTSELNAASSESAAKTSAVTAHNTSASAHASGIAGNAATASALQTLARSTAYAVGDLAAASALAFGLVLYCSTAGTTDASARYHYRRNREMAGAKGRHAPVRAPKLHGDPARRHGRCNRPRDAGRSVHDRL